MVAEETCKMSLSAETEFVRKLAETYVAVDGGMYCSLKPDHVHENTRCDTGRAFKNPEEIGTAHAGILSQPIDTVRRSRVAADE